MAAVAAPDRATASAAVAAPYLEVRGLHKAYGAVQVLRDVSFGITEGEFVCFLGPSGCGKTTLLMCLAGLEQAGAGDIRKQGGSISHLPTSQRDVGIVFQSYALFPNLTVQDNVGFGLESLRKPRKEIDRTVGDLLALLSLEQHGHKYPSQLSGGQQQRVALARALALSPSLLLLDEPLSALDALVRHRLRGELRDLQKRLGLTTVMVTHDQEEAQSMADRIVLMNQGCIEQIGTPWEIYNQPRTAFVADFIGASNLYDGTGQADGVAVGALQSLHIRCPVVPALHRQPVRLLLRPEDVRLSPVRDDAAFGQAEVTKIEYLGPVARVYLVLPGDLPLVADVAKRDFSARRMFPGARLWAGVDPGHLTVFPA